MSLNGDDAVFQDDAVPRMSYTIWIQSLSRPFIPMKAAQWCMKQKWIDFPGLKIPRSDAALLPNHWARGHALVTLRLLRLCVIRVEPATSGLALR